MPADRFDPTGCERCLDAGAYVLGALDDHEVVGFRHHLDGCPACADQVRTLQVAADILPIAAPPVVAPAAIKGRLMAVVEREAELLRAAGPDADRVPAVAPRRRRRGLPHLGRLVLRPPVAVGLACAFVALGVGGGLLVNGAGDEPRDPAVPVVARTPVQGGLTAPRVRGELVVQDGRGTLRLTRMPAAEKGRVYQVWLVAKGTATPRPTHTLFNVRSDGRATVAIEEPVAGVSEVLVTAERSGGSLTPSGDPVIEVRPA